MRVVLVSSLAAIVVAVLVGASLFALQEPIYRSLAMTGVRVGDPGHNLVGENWRGTVRTEGGREQAASGEVTGANSGRL